ncbi:MAG TPA: hypothetical protein VGN99_11985 [Steroidobacteraceae bacterium]|nr:hypothetical protein [Steroidobacteraceae bacterium]
MCRAFILGPALILALWIAPAGKVDAGSWTFDHSTFDQSADPCTDFYQHVCGAWDNPANIAPDKPSASWAWDVVVGADDRDLQKLLQGDKGSADPEVIRLRTFFAACMVQDAATEQAAGRPASTRCSLWGLAFP